MNPHASGIEFRQVTKRYGDERSALVVKGVDFAVPKGSLTTVLGPSGCGKTTLLRMIAGLESPTSGQILIDGQDVTALGPAERNVSMVFQSYALFPHMSVIDNVRFGLDVTAVPRDQAQERACKALKTVGLEGLDQRLPSELSGGQQQRVAVARALVLEPAVLLFDEPLSNLDARLRRSMRDEIRNLQQSLGLTVAYVTHDQSEALAVSDQIIVMEAGLIAQTGSPEDLYERPRTTFVAGFMGEATLLDAEVDSNGQVHLGPMVFAPRHAVAPGRVKAAVRPEAWILGESGPDALPAILRRSAYLGHVLELTLDTPLGPLLVVAAQWDQSLTTGHALGLRLSGRGVSIISD